MAPGADGASSTEAAAEPEKLFSLVERWFVGLLLAQIIAFALVPLLPLALAAGALATPVRGSRWRVVALFATGSLLSLIVVAPLLLQPLGLQLVQNGPVRTVAPGHP